MDFADWLKAKFIEWEQSQDRRQSYSAFARYLGVRQSSLSQWMNGGYPPGLENVTKIADKLGPEVYDVLGLVRPDDDLVIVRAVFSQADDGEKDELNRIIMEWARDHGYSTLHR